MVEIIIKDSESGQRLNKYLLKYLNQATSSFVYKMLRKKNIVLNDKKAQGDELLACGDNIKLYLADDTIAKFRTGSIVKDKAINKIAGDEKAANNSAIKKRCADKSGATGATNGEHRFVKDLTRNLRILYEDKEIMAVHKDAGILSQKADKNDYSINEAIVDFIRVSDKYEKVDTFTPSVCNRLDRNTSGIVLAGITLKGSQFLSKALKDRTVDKYYYTVVKGVFKSRLTCQAYLAKNKDKNLSRVYSVEEYMKLSKDKNFDDKAYQMIKTEFIPISSNNNNTLLKIKLITGKSHQIRAHLKYMGYPVAGDIKYGDKKYNNYLKDKYGLKYHLLHAGEVRLSDDVVIKDPLPDIFMKICKGEGLKL